jgi:hypothetical protein
LHERAEGAKQPKIAEVREFSVCSDRAFPPECLLRVDSAADHQRESGATSAFAPILLQKPLIVLADSDAVALMRFAAVGPRMLIIGDVFAIRSERALSREISKKPGSQFSRTAYRFT